MKKKYTKLSTFL